MSSKKTEFIVNDLMSKIFQQKFWNNKLPTQRDLACAYGVSRFTIQKALKRLEAIGLIESIQGDGIYIRERALGNPLVSNSLTEVPYEDLEDSVQNYVLQKKYKISHFMTNYRPAVLSADAAEIMNVKKGTPAMDITSRGLLKDGSIFIYSRIKAIHYECTYIIPFNKDVYASRRSSAKKKTSRS